MKNTSTLLKRIFILSLFAALFLGNSSMLKAQCGGSVNLDQSVSANGASTFSITTTFPNELIMISYDGFTRQTPPPVGPVTVDGNPATQINMAHGGGFTGTAEVFAYACPTAGTHTIICDETGWFFNNEYFVNSAASFYATGYNTVLTLSSITSSVNNAASSSFDASITTVLNNSMIYCDGLDNTGVSPAHPIIWTGATALSQFHVLDGIDCSDAYEPAATAGSYSVTANNNFTFNNETELVLVAIENTGLTPVTSIINQAACGSGVVDVSFVSGIAPYTYLWSNGGTTDTISGLSLGTYTVTVTDGNGCSGSGSVTLAPASPLTIALTTNIQPTNCLPNGQLGVTVGGGTAPYTYSWSNGGTNAIDTGLLAGTYTLTVTDNCLSSSSVDYTLSTSGLDASAFVINDYPCNSSADGSAAVSVAPGAGVPPYTYAWSNGETTDTAINLAAGFYTVVVTDNNGCSATRTIQIHSPGFFFSFTNVIDPTNCDSNGKAWAVPFGGAPPYTYLWSNGATTDTISNLPPVNFAIYTVTVTDHCGSTSVDEAFVFSSGLTYNIGEFTQVNGPSCSSTDAYVFNIAGSPPYTYLWSDGETTDTATHLPNGFDHVTVTAGGGCTSEQFFFISGSGPSAFFIQETNPCPGDSNGILTIDAFGGSPPYTYSWSNGETTSTVTDLPAGSYTVTVTDACGNSTSDQWTFFPESSIDVSAVITQEATCSQLGCVTATVTGGANFEYTFNWYDSTNTLIFSSFSFNGNSSTDCGLVAGNYSIVVSDANGCTGSTSFAITQPAILLANATVISDVSCLVQGSAQSSPTGGTTPYTYSWSNGATTAVITGLSAGTYSVTVTDSNACTATGSVTITQPAGILNAIASVTSNPNCFNATGGSAQVVASNGNPPYTYSWSNGATTSSVSGLSAGTYTVTVNDNSGCIVIDPVTITIPPPLQICTLPVTVNFPYTGSLQSFTVPAGVTSATITAIGGSGGGDNAENTQGGAGATMIGVVSLIPGNTLNIVSGGQGSENFGIDGGAGGGGSFVWDNTANNLLVVAGGGGGGEWEINNGNPASITTTPTGAGGGSGELGGTATTFDAGGGGAGYLGNGATEGSNQAGSGGNDQANGFAGGAGDIQNDPTVAGGYGGGGGAGFDGGGGGGGYNGGGAGSGNFPGGGGGSYVNGSISSTATTNIGNGSVSISYTIPGGSIIVDQNVSCNGGSNGSLSVACVSGGTSPYTYSWAPGGASTATVSGLSAGTYSLTITDSIGCTLNSTATITQPAALLANATVTSNVVSCNILGSAQAAPTGGTPSYTYSWSNGATTSSVSSLTAGSYTVTVTDSNACTATGSVTITQPANVLAAAVTVTANETCGNSNIGSAQALASGGTTPYTYSWSNGATTSSISGLSAGTYTITVNDNAGCGTTGSVTITQPDQIVICASGPPITQTYLYTGSLQSFTVPAGVTSVTVNAIGAAGGYFNAGLGAQIEGSFAVNPGDVLDIISAGQGGYNGDAGGGGGGSFVWNTNGNILMVAAGGGGGGNICSWSGSNASVDSVPVTGAWAGSGTGGTGGNGGAGGTGSNLSATFPGTGGGGCGWLSNGLNGTFGTYIGDGGIDPLNGGAGGVGAVTFGANGGYGGGGGSGGNCGAAGGGGGYNGGGGADNWNGFEWGGAGGGGSYDGGTAILATAGIGSANGSVAISYPSFTGLIVTNVTCFNGTNGSASVPCATGGTSPYTYSWAPGGATTATASNLSAGTYTVTVSGASGCSATATATITQPSQIDDSVVAVSVVNELCNGNSTGSATIGVIGGVAPYTYTWTPNVSNTSSASGLSAGTYSITVMDNNGCSGSTAVVTITQPNVIDDSIVAASVVNVTCNGLSNGSATVGVIGGTSPYTYNWTPNVSNSATASGLSAGTYSVNITDANGCSGTTAVVTITQPNVIDDSIVAASVVNVTCNGLSNGSATVGVIGGTAPYTYNWTPNVSNSATASGLSAGTYSVNITDANGCTSTTTSVTITQPNIIDDSIVTASIVNVSCNGGSNGSATVGVIGGTAPYTYNWTPNVSSTATASGLSAGTYSVNITDNNGCSGTSVSVTITQPNVIDDSVVTASNITCNGLNNGSVTIGVIGGTSPYTYNWTPNVSNTATASGLSVGTYTVNITDNNGCSGTSISVTITQPAVLNDSIVSVATINVSCKGDSTGSITVGATGGTSPYTYNWTPNISSTATASGLSAGTYSVSVTDNNGCVGPMESVTITQPFYRLIDSVAVLYNVGCYQGNQGGISIGVRGGVPPYTYAWTPSVSSTYTASGLSAGTYTVSITDNIGCNHILAVTITQPSAALIDTVTSVVSPVCNGGFGTATIGVAGGTPAYNYQWIPSVSTSATATNLVAGTYTVIVNDSHGCNASCTVTVTQTPAIRDSIITASTVEVSCNGGSNGSGTIGVAGGASPYTYTWSPNVSTTATANGLSAGSYSVTVTDMNGCSSSTVVVNITQPLAITDNISIISNVGCNGGNGGSASANVSGGTSPYTYLWSPSGQTTYSATGLTVGTYTVSVTDNNGCNSTASVTITQPALLRDTVTSITNLVCSGLGSSATVGTTGGTQPYNYSWNPNVSTTASCSSLNVGVYTVTVSDANGCMATCTVDISQPAPIFDSIVSALTIEVSCPGGSNGSATVGVRGGFAPYTYTWTPNVSSTATATGLSAGTYSVVVNDSHGCSGNIATVTITQPLSGIKDSAAVVVNVGCFGSDGGSISIGTRGGVAPYTYLWSPNVSSVYHASGLSAGTYSVTVTDNNGCSNSLAVTVTQPASALSINVTSTTYPVCYGGTGTASVGTTGGTSPYNYQWALGLSTTASATGIPAGYYTVVVIDAHGCRDTTSVTVTQPAQMIINTVYDNVTSHAGGGCNGIAGITSVVNGTPPYTYLWTPGGQTTDSITRQCAGDYCVTVTDANGCSENTCIGVGTTVGIPTISGSSTISIYPDPNNGMFTITGVTEGQIIEIYNAIGQQMSTIVADNTTMHFNIADKADGVYLVRILYKNGTLAGQTKMIKTK